MCAINNNSPTPLYIQVADWIRKKIYSSEWEEKTQIPTELELQKTLQVSRGTLKKGIALLIKEGLLIQSHGRGTFVTRQSFSYPLGEGLLSFAETLRRQNIQFTTKLIEKKFEAATESIKKTFSLEKGEEILFLKRVRFVDEEPIMIMENRINTKFCKGIQKVDFNKESLFTQIEKLSNKNIKYSESRYAARILDEERAKLLDVHKESPSLHLEQTVFLQGDIPVEWGNVWLKSNKYIVGTILQR